MVSVVSFLEVTTRKIETRNVIIACWQQNYYHGCVWANYGVTDRSKYTHLRAIYMALDVLALYITYSPVTRRCSFSACVAMFTTTQDYQNLCFLLHLQSLRTLATSKMFTANLVRSSY